VFILCTTESHKIPATIASRCQHFSFRSVDFNDLIVRMHEICVQEGIEADDEALAVIAQSGEGSVRDSLSALDQAIACCGNKLEAAAVRALLGAFGLDAMSQVTTALPNQDGGAMLALVDELERNGGSPQHFSRELSRYLRNLLVTKIAGGDSRLIAASQAERVEMTRIAAAFGEEDLTRYLQLSLDLFRDLQFSLQPRFHLEIGLLKMVQAGKLISVEEALASLPARAPEPRPAAAAAPPKPIAPPAPVRTAASPIPPSPVEIDRAKLHAAMIESGLQFSADALAQSEVALVNNELIITARKSFQLDLGREEILTALKRLGQPGLRFKVVFGEVKAAPPEVVKPAAQQEDEVTGRALAHPEVQRFRELFGGEVRAVRNLKEPWNE
jgi:DNA polymerase-3 subunit gamma/tau